MTAKEKAMVAKFYDALNKGQCTLYNCYANPSKEKITAYNKYCKLYLDKIIYNPDLSHLGMAIPSYSKQFFTFAYSYKNTITDEIWLCYITPSQVYNIKLN